MRRTVRAAVLTGAISLLAASGAVLATPAAADPADCVTGSDNDTYQAYAECPAGAGDFEFRVVADGAGISGFHTVYGPWVRASADTAVRSEVVCQYAPKCEVISASIEFR
ncbi:hypothetical protein [Streptomyces litchfieldiae]|uniref:Secreted protein n=1 Tax=Streptomyces litchfieldiae TaxID=3075543 RepID=A0ABU2MX93_9ACTN|nr:hypothetical protein [Streptomyces sp. DSM 44938]MDT0346271.1 hypothetical protein [Streptomyces sp. DSM 44938]